MVGHGDFELVWVSLYRFPCRRLARFVHGRVIFAGDAAHQVSPFGARGANSGIQDADNLGWKLAAVLAGRESERLIESYDAERCRAADENMLNSSRATDFIAPRSPGERVLRDAALALAGEAAFARAMVNSGRLSLPTHYGERGVAGTPTIGAPLLDGPLEPAGWLSEALAPGLPVLLIAGEGAADGSDALRIARAAPGGILAARYGLGPGEAVLLRPDGHLAARLAAGDEPALCRALDTMMMRVP